MGDEAYPKMAWQARTQGRTLTEFGRSGTEDFEGKRNSMARSKSYSSRL
jgi:hypothetical protein